MSGDAGYTKATVWVCTACGKTSPDRYGNHADTMRGWDASCFLHAVECDAESIERAPDGRVRAAIATSSSNSTSAPVTAIAAATGRE